VRDHMSMEITQPGWSSRRMRLLFGFVALGITLSVITIYVSTNFESLGVPGALCLLVLLPPMAVVAVVGLRQGAHYFSEFWSEWTFGHGLIFLLYISTFVFRVRDVNAAKGEPLDAWSLLRLGPEAIVAGFLIIRLISRRSDWLKSLFQGIIGALATYGLVCTVSSIWSVYHTWTLYKSLEFLLDLSVMAAILASVQNVKQMRSILNWIWALYAVELLWVWMCAAIWPSLSFDEGRLSGFWPVAASNSIGASASVICIVALARFLNREAQRTERAWYALLFAFCFVSLLASQTRNAMAGLVFGVFLVLVLEKRIRIGLLSLGAIMARLIYVCVSLTSWPSLSQLPAVLFGPRIAGFLARTQTESQIEGLSSRVDWWSFAWQQFMHHPFTGLGAYAAGKFAVLGKLGVGTASQMHSDWMEVLAGTSLWGLIPFLVALVWCWVVLVRNWRDRLLPGDERLLLTEAIAVLGVITLRSFFNVELSWHAPLLYFGVIGYAEFLRRTRKQRSLARAGSASASFSR
jgi:hypothetical protein